MIKNTTVKFADLKVGDTFKNKYGPWQVARAYEPNRKVWNKAGNAYKLDPITMNKVDERLYVFSHNNNVELF